LLDYGAGAQIVALVLREEEMRTRFIVSTFLVGALLAFLWPDSAGAGADHFKKLKCNKCHSITALGIEATKDKDDDEDVAENDAKEPPDLSTASAERDAEWLAKWLKKDVKNEDGKKHKPKFKGTDEDLNKVVEFMTTLK
jgi:cytochrome c1